ncbi:MAG TPA: prolyl-tRNA synthetase associated domain-containing protein [Bacteroidales bacterium]|nr:prolyl-tRNA synthetase associated domain-containing protein [Bacteroidales bacterium]
MSNATEKQKVLHYLEELHIPFDLYEHPPLPTIEDAVKYWADIEATHCKNLFFRNHKGNRHYLVILEHRRQLDIHDLEKRLKQGKLSFASEKRMQKWLGIKPGSVSVFGLINDVENHVHVFLDEKIRSPKKISFHPNDNSATVVISFSDFEKYLDSTGNSFEYLALYD